MQNLTLSPYRQVGYVRLTDKEKCAGFNALRGPPALQKKPVKRSYPPTLSCHSLLVSVRESIRRWHLIRRALKSAHKGGGRQALADWKALIDYFERFGGSLSNVVASKGPDGKTVLETLVRNRHVELLIIVHRKIDAGWYGDVYVAQEIGNLSSESSDYPLRRSSKIESVCQISPRSVIFRGDVEYSARYEVVKPFGYGLLCWSDGRYYLGQWKSYFTGKKDVVDVALVKDTEKGFRFVFSLTDGALEPPAVTCDMLKRCSPSEGLVRWRRGRR